MQPLNLSFDIVKTKAQGGQLTCPRSQEESSALCSQCFSHSSNSFTLWARKLSPKRQSNLDQVRHRASEIPSPPGPVICILHLSTSGCPNLPHHFPSPVLSTQNSRPPQTKMGLSHSQLSPKNGFLNWCSEV